MFNIGKMQYDSTYIGDIAEGVIRMQNVILVGDVPYSLLSIGNSQSIELARFICAIEAACDRGIEK